MIVTAAVTGGTEGSSRVQWFKTTSLKLEGENGLEAVSTSKIAKVGNFFKFAVTLLRIITWLLM